MGYYLLQQYVVLCSAEELHNCTDKQYVAVLRVQNNRDVFYKTD